MTEVIAAGEWFSYLRREYLDEYLRAGGASVKFAVAGESGATTEIVNQARVLAMDSGFVPIAVDAAETRMHLIERVFFACASQVPWTRLTDTALRRFATDEGFSAPPSVPTGSSFAQAVATHTGMDIDFVRNRLAQRVQTHVYRDRAMIRDFRLAMTWLCQGRLTGAPSSIADADLIEQWLTGRISRIGALKHLAIFTKINRTNARLHLESLLHWLRVAHIPGTVLIFNVDRLLKTRRDDAGEHYSRAALLDAYEVLRQFIDSSDELEGLLLVVVASDAILDADSRQRGLAAYHALRNRVYDEVRDREHANPAGALVRLAEGVPRD